MGRTVDLYAHWVQSALPVIRSEQMRIALRLVVNGPPDRQVGPAADYGSRGEIYRDSKARRLGPSRKPGAVSLAIHAPLADPFL